MHVVEQDEGGGGDRADAPGAQADPAQRLESGLEQRVAAFGERSGGRVQSVDRALIVAQGSVGGALDRDGEGVLFALVAQVGEGGVVLVGSTAPAAAAPRRARAARWCHVPGP